jgi:hypothetical protein
LTAHHIIPVEFRGRDTLSNLITLCSNCHRIVHWLATGDRSLEAHAYGLGQPGIHRRELLELARRIRRWRLRVVKGGILTPPVPLKMAMDAVIQRNGMDGTEAMLMNRCFKRALRAMRANDRKQCSVRLPRGSRFISVIANSTLVIRAPAWGCDNERCEENFILIWPKKDQPSAMSPSRFRHASDWRSKRIPEYVWLRVTWDECLSLSKDDWKLFRKACHEAFTRRARPYVSNVERL